MEIEAKFVVPNRQAYRSLLRLRDLAGYALIPTSASNLVDRYLDTADGRLLAAGYACRLRTEGASVLATLKGLASTVGGAEDGVHRREEHEIRLAEWAPDPAAWPPSPARELALRLAAGDPLQPLFDLEQHRSRADVMLGMRRVAAWSLDAVRVVVGRRPALYYELEIELQPEGTEADLAPLSRELREAHGLAAEPRSKFHRALETLRDRGTAIEGRLSAQERSTLEVCAAGPDPELARRAAAVLGWADGLPTREIVLRSGLSSGRVRFWLRAFRAHRMGVFEQPAGADQERTPRRRPTPAALRIGTESVEPRTPRGRPAAKAGPPRPQAVIPAALVPETPAQTAPEEAPAPVPPHPGSSHSGPLTVSELCEAQNVDMAHAAFVADRAVVLFDTLSRIHDQPRKRRKLLRQAALLCTVGTRQDAQRPHRAGRDLILAEPLAGMSTGDRLLLAAIVALQRAKPKPDKEPIMDALEPKQREMAVALAALLQVAEALDFSRTQATRIESLEGAASVHCEIALTGPAANIDARQAAARGAWWQRLHKQELVFTAAPVTAAPTGDGSPDAAGKTPIAPPAVEIPPVRGDEPMSEAGRKLLQAHFLRMLANEGGTRLGEEIEALHDMRVATRRMRAAYRIFEPHFEPKAVRSFNKSLRLIGATLGAVRDLDVLMETAEAHQGALPIGEVGSLAPLLDDWRSRRELARRDLLQALDGGAYRRFVVDFQGFLTTPGAGARLVPPGEPIPYQVRHVAPRLIFERYEAVRAYEPMLRDPAPVTTYHRLRIDCKRLRYMLEFFRDVLGPEAPDLIRQVTGMQDLLGALQDAHVAEGLIQTFLEDQAGKRKRAQPHNVLAGVERYLDAQRTRQRELLAAFPAPWSELIGADFRRSLALAVAAL